MNFNLHFGKLHGDNSINDKNNLFEIFIPKCYKVKRILISLNCFSEYIKMFLFKKDFSFKVRKRAEIRNQYNQAPHLTQDTNGKLNGIRKGTKTERVGSPNEKKTRFVFMQNFNSGRVIK